MPDVAEERVLEPPPPAARRAARARPGARDGNGRGANRCRTYDHRRRARRVRGGRAARGGARWGDGRRRRALPPPLSDADSSPTEDPPRSRPRKASTGRAASTTPAPCSNCNPRRRSTRRPRRAHDSRPAPVDGAVATRPSVAEHAQSCRVEPAGAGEDGEGEGAPRLDGAVVAVLGLDPAASAPR